MTTLLENARPRDAARREALAEVGNGSAIGLIGVGRDLPRPDAVEGHADRVRLEVEDLDLGVDPLDHDAERDRATVRVNAREVDRRVEACAVDPQAEVGWCDVADSRHRSKVGYLDCNRGLYWREGFF